MATKNMKIIYVNIVRITYKGKTVKTFLFFLIFAIFFQN